MTKYLDGAYSHTPSKEERKVASIAKAWKYDPGLEQVARMKRDSPTQYALVSPRIAISIGYYMEAKATARAAGVDTSGAGQ